VVVLAIVERERGARQRHHCGKPNAQRKPVHAILRRAPIRIVDAIKPELSVQCMLK
jgi:hypothetical protein